MKTWHMFFALFLALLSAGGTKAACPTPTTDQTIALPGHPFAAEPSPDNCRLFVSLINGSGGGAVAVLANDGGVFRTARVVPVKHGSGGGVALSHDGTLLAVAAEESVLLFDVAKLETPDQDPIVGIVPENDRGAIYAQFSKDDSLLFVSEERNASIAVIDVVAGRQGTPKVRDRIAVGQAPVGLALSPDGTHLFSTSESVGSSNDCPPEQTGGRAHAAGALFSIDTAKAVTDPRHAISTIIRAGCNPVRVAVSSDGHSLWISARGDGRVMGVDPATLSTDAASTQMRSIAVGQSPVGLALRPDGSQLWVANSDRFAKGGGSLALIAPATPADARLAGTMAMGAFPRDLRFMADGRTLVVALFGAGAVMLHPIGAPPSAAGH